MNTKQIAKIQKIARICDKATEKFLEVIEFSISLSEVGRLEFLPSVVSDLSSFEKKLRDAGAILPKDDEKLERLLASVAKSDAPAEWVYEARTGWTRDKNTFVLVDQVIGNSKTKVIGVNRQTLSTTPAVGCRTAAIGNPGAIRWRNRPVSRAF